MTDKQSAERRWIKPLPAAIMLYGIGVLCSLALAMPWEYFYEAGWRVFAGFVLLVIISASVVGLMCFSLWGER